MTREHSRLEIACHGFTRLPLLESIVGRESAEYEIETACEIATHKGIDFKTFVYPRNLVGHADVLQSRNFIGYREKKLPVSGVSGRVRALVSEFNIFQTGQPNTIPGKGIAKIPAGEFFNWRKGLRKFVPQHVTVRRWKSILRNAAADGEVALLWFHPRNLIDGPQTFEVLEQVIQEACKLRDAGKLKIETQEPYVESLLHRDDL